jgi:hypothetical protein
MSIKRAKPKVVRRASNSGSNKGFISPAATTNEPTWQEAVADKPEDAFTAYAMSGSFAKGVLLNHPTFGKGIVLNVDGRKMEVLFAESKKILTMGAPKPLDTAR